MRQELRDERARNLVRSRTPITVRLDNGLASFSRCRQEWADLVPTELQSVWHCAMCSKDVHLVADLNGFDYALAQGLRIAARIENELFCGGRGDDSPYEAAIKLEWE